MDPAVNLADFAKRTVTGWFSAMYKSKAMVGEPGTPQYQFIMIKAAEDYFNNMDRRLTQGNDVYITDSMNNICLEFGGVLPCVFLELVAATVTHVALSLAKLNVVQEASLHSYETLMEIVHNQFDVIWDSLQTTLSDSIRRGAQTCGDKADSVHKCGGNLQPGAQNRFRFDVSFETNNDANEETKETKDSEQSNKCGYCTAVAKCRCSRCHTTYYCNRECQHQHWNVHKAECSKIQ